MDVEHHGGLFEKQRGERPDRTGVEDAAVMWSRGYARSVLLQAYLECLNAVFHSKQRHYGSTPRLQTKLVKMLTCKTKVSDCGDAYKFCLEMWDELSLALNESQDSSASLPSKEELIHMRGCEVVIRLALLADFYRYQREDLVLNEVESMGKLCAIRTEAFRFLTRETDVRPGLKQPSLITLPSKQSAFLQPSQITAESSNHKKCLISPQLNHPTTSHLSEHSAFGQTRERTEGYAPRTPPEQEADPCLGLNESAVPSEPSQRDVTVATAGSKELTTTKKLSRKRKPEPGPCASSVCNSKRNKAGYETKENKKNRKNQKKVWSKSAVKAAGYGEDSVRWSKFSFSARRKSYYVKLIRAFQVVKTVGYPMLTLNSEWGLSCYYKLAVAYTTDQPLEMAAACLPQLRRAVDIIHSEQFQKLSELKLECQMLLYAVLNCHINWVDHNHKQILLVPGQPSALPPRDEGDLRCSRCLKNQTFHSSEVRGNPRNIDVEFDFEQMKFGSSCCAADMILVPLSTRAVNTCTFTEMKQMYTSCVKCRRTIFSEVLVDTQSLYSRCVACTSKGL